MKTHTGNCSRIKPIACAVLLAAASQSSMGSIELARKNSCTACHSVDHKIVGPAFADVAKKYAGQPEALATVIQNIRAGGSGKWGPIPMPAQDQLSQNDIKTLANWILKLPH